MDHVWDELSTEWQFEQLLFGQGLHDDFVFNFSPGNGDWHEQYSDAVQQQQPIGLELFPNDEMLWATDFDCHNQIHQDEPDHVIDQQPENTEGPCEETIAKRSVGLQVIEAGDLSKNAHSTVLQEQGRAVLKRWTQENPKSLYPDRNVRGLLAREAGLSLRQVTTWFSNYRQRVVKTSLVQQPENRSPSTSCVQRSSYCGQSSEEVSAPSTPQAALTRSTFSSCPEASERQSQDLASLQETVPFDASKSKHSYVLSWIQVLPQNCSAGHSEHIRSSHVDETLDRRSYLALAHLEEGKRNPAWRYGPDLNTTDIIAQYRWKAKASSALLQNRTLPASRKPLTVVAQASTVDNVSHMYPWGEICLPPRDTHSDLHKADVAHDTNERIAAPVAENTMPVTLQTYLACSDQSSDCALSTGTKSQASSSASWYSLSSRGSRRGRRLMHSMSTDGYGKRCEFDVDRVCQLCFESFSRKSSLKRHFQSVHRGERKWLCANKKTAYCLCGEILLDCPHNMRTCWSKDESERTFYRLDNFRRHLEVTHGLSAHMADIDLKVFEVHPWRAE